MEDIISQTKAEYNRTRERMLLVFANTPDDKLHFSPSPTARTPLELFAHSALAVNGICGMLTGKPFPFTSTAEADNAFRAAEKEVKTRDEALALMAQHSATFLAWLDTVTPEQLASTIDFVRPIPMAVAITFPEHHMRSHMDQLEYVQTIYGDRDWRM